MGDKLTWDERSAAYIASRSTRYPDGMDIDPPWTQEVMDDARLVAFEPDPKSRMGASRFIGHSQGAQRLLVVIAYRDLDGDLHGVNAWPATGADQSFYNQESHDDQEPRA